MPNGSPRGPRGDSRDDGIRRREITDAAAGPTELGVVVIVDHVVQHAEVMVSWVLV